MNSLYKFFTHNLIYCHLILSFFIGCGGGTSGSGLDPKIYQGKVLATDGRILSDVSVTIESTGDTAVTNSEGEFQITSNSQGGEVPFNIQSSEFNSYFSLNNISDDSSRVSINITVDTENDIVKVDHFSLKAQFVGNCDYYFENREIIRQANFVPDGTLCTLKVTVKGDGKKLARIPIALQYASCQENATWETIKESQTQTGKNIGVSQINFPYYDSKKFCRYRVVAPFRYSSYSPIFYPIDTFTEQEYFRK